MERNRILLIGCGILRKEVDWLLRKNRWPVDTLFFESSLHSDYARLADTLKAALEANRDRERVVFYGCCHPLMDRIVAAGGARRIAAQNCIEMLLGQELFVRELSRGAYFLLEDWAARWKDVNSEIFGGRMDIAQAVYQGDRKYLLLLNTPLSSDFTAKAAEISGLIGLPVRGMSVPLTHLEAALREALGLGRGGGP